MFGLCSGVGSHDWPGHGRGISQPSIFKKSKKFQRFFMEGILGI
jgi:hypothetical protein